MNITKIAFYLLMAIVLVAGIFFYRWIFGYLFFALILSYILDPIVSWFELRRVPRWLSVLVVYALVAGLLAWFSARFVPDLIRQGNNLIALIRAEEGGSGKFLISLPFVRSIHDFLANLDARIPTLDLSAKFVQLIDSASAQLGHLPKILVDNYQTILGTISFVATIPLISFFLLKDKHRFRKAMISLAPNRYFELTIIIMNKIDETVGRFLRAMIFEVIAVSIMVSASLSIVGVPYAVLIGVTAGVANIIPYFGPFTGGAVAVLVILIEGGPPVMILWTVLALYLVQVVDNNIIYPVVVGTTIKMHPLIVLLTVLAGGWFGGIIWMLISVPLVYMVYSLVKELYLNLRQFRLI
jgi:predicted PurR-regulated permease PerM